jgi:tetratricopeptide (TPR) repeat protein
VDESTRRQRLGQRLEGYPLLRTLVLDGPFFWAFSFAVALSALIAISVPKQWQTTPEGFSRARIKVSLIDLTQAWSLARTARAQEKTGDFRLALQSWRGALVNNLGDSELHRGLLELLRNSPEARSDQVIPALFSTTWLLALTRTNEASLALSLDVLEKLRLPDLALRFLDESPHPEAPVLQPGRARCLLAAGKPDEFIRLWETNAMSWQDDRRQRLYHDAWTAGWGTGSPSIEALVRLKTALELPGNLGTTAARLLILAGPRKGVPEDLALAVARLDQDQASAVTQHAAYWRFLAATGRFDEAKLRAASYQTAPRVPTDAADYAATLASFGLRDEAIQFLNDNLARFQNNPTLWEVYLSILGDARRWNEVRRVVSFVRTETASFETARILGIFAEYRAEVAEQRPHSADQLAQQLANARILDNDTALRVAGELMRDQRSAAALAVLKAKERDMPDRMVYWQGVLAAAFAVQDFPSLQKSTSEMLRLAPGNPVALSNRAAMLLAIEESPAEALEITFRLVNEHPEVAPFHINHALSLLLAGRIADAWTQLATLDPTRLERQAASAYYYALARVYLAREEWDAAAEAAGKVQPGLLLPPQAAKLAKLRTDLAKRRTTPSP